MSYQTSLDSFFRHIASGRTSQRKAMDEEQTTIKRNLTLRKSLQHNNSKKATAMKSEDSVSSSNENLLTPTETLSHCDISELKNKDRLLVQVKTPDKLFNIKETMESEEKKSKKRSLSLNRSPRPHKSSKILSQPITGLESEDVIICISSSSEDLLTPPEQKAQTDSKLGSKMCLSQGSTQDNVHNAKEEIVSPNSSADSSATIVYNISYNTSQKSPRTPSKTPQTPKSSSKFFSPTKKRVVFKKGAVKRNLDFQFQNNRTNDSEYDKVNKETKYQDDKTLALLNITKQYLRTDGLKNLLKEESSALLSNFVQMEECCMRVVCRLYWRQIGWYRTEQLEEIATGKNKFASSSLDEILKTLQDKGWITSAQSSGDGNMDFDDYVKMLKRPQLLEVCKDLKLKMQSKMDGVDALKKYCQSTGITSYFTGKSGNNRTRVLKMLKDKTGDCYKLSDLGRYTLYKLYILMYMGMDYSIIREKRLELILLHEKIKKETYPIDKNMEIDNASVVFQCQEDFYRYLEAHQLNERYAESADTREHCDIVIQAYKLYQEITEDDMSRYKALPSWLRRYTPANIYIKILENGVQDLKKGKSEEQYTIAVQILDSMIAQEDFRQHNLYKWFSEKALILHKHLEHTEQAVHTLLEGFKASLSEEAKDILRPRAKQIVNQRNLVLNDELRQALRVHSDHEYIIESNIPADHVYKQPMDNHKQKGKLKFEAHLEQGRSIMSAEVYCVVHYTHNGEFTHGEHWEGRIVTTIFFLLFWDIIYTKPERVPGIFMSHYQRYPMDLFTGNFYANRKTAIDERIKLIEESSDETVIEMMQNRWEERPEYEVSDICRDMGWASVSAVGGCLGARPLAAICRRLAHDYRYTHSGFPDLTLWNVHTKKIKFVEVKTDADKPSMKQLQWLQYLIANNIAAGFCYVGVNTTRCKARSRDNAPPQL